ncbi:MAG TPA: NAD(P)(+) transhydrogenase (Re/Si-specific) subunit beta [Candidatus Acidoferrales bacterium]|nr:NAD(P)(+) transhydrogenase (Re/Si-specific) subunit beta [Candidatus Acidoferrales bacterium]
MAHSSMSFAVQASYLIATFLLIIGLKRMSSPRSARNGMIWAGVGMLLATVVTFVYLPDVYRAAAVPGEEINVGYRIVLIVIAIAVGGVPAWWSGRRVPLTDMPQMVAIYNGLGGGAAAAIGAVELYSGRAYAGSLEFPLIAVIGALVGAIGLGGSIIAFLKLQGLMGSPRIIARNAINGALGVFLLLLTVLSVHPEWVSGANISTAALVSVFLAVSLFFGIMLTLPIGGADMPVVISTYNACIGLAVGFEGFVLQNPAMIIAGTIVGAAGTLLTVLMAKAMNRSFFNIWFSGFGDVTASAQKAGPQQAMKSMDARDAAASMAYAEDVIVVPGYGLAVAQAQHKLWELMQMLQKRGVRVRFAIHPVAGRMPGHMSVLLAEAGVPYDLIFDLDEINSDFATADVALVIGANDVVNPAARTDKSSPIYGMPILNADQAQQVFVIKRGRGAGFSGIENELFFGPNTQMVFGDAQDVISKMIQGLKEL